MHFSLLLTGAFAITAAAAPFQFPLPDGFPSPDAASLSKISEAAGGQQSNAPPPKTISPDGITVLKLLSLAETLEVAFFSELLSNVTNHVPGYQPENLQQIQQLPKILQRIVAQEEQHALNVNGALTAMKVATIKPCRYSFPVTSLKSAVALAQTFTEASLGVLPEAQRIFAENGDDALVQLLGSVVGQEGEQAGFFRLFQDRTPSSAPFLTAVPMNFVFTALQGFVHDCPNLDTIPLQTYQPLSLLSTDVKPVNQTLQFSFPQGKHTPTSIVYISGQNLPVVVPFKQTSVKNGLVYVDASFPFQTPGSLFNNGLTIAAATSNPGPFSSADAVANATLFGPALIEVS